MAARVQGLSEVLQARRPWLRQESPALNAHDCLVTAYETIKDWQTLLAGALAIVAARMAAKPVWQQLERMETQSRIMVRETLVRRIEELEMKRRAAWAALSDAVHPIERDLGYWLGDTTQINEHWAFEKSQTALLCKGRFHDFREANRDTPEIEQAKDAIDTAFPPLIACLDDIHIPASTQQHEEDHDISDDDWALIEQRGRDARGEVPDLTAAVGRACGTLDQAYATALNVVRIRLASIDQHLLEHVTPADRA